MLKNDKCEIHGSVNRFRDLVYIDDVVDIVSKLLELRTFPLEIINIGTGKKTTVKEIIEGICYAIGKDYANIDIVQPKKTLGDINGIYADNTMLTNLFPKLNFLNFKEGIKLMAKHYK